jgi:hypothetical protein
MQKKAVGFHARQLFICRLFFTFQSPNSTHLPLVFAFQSPNSSHCRLFYNCAAGTTI